MSRARVGTLADYPQGQRFYEATGWDADGNTRDHRDQVRYSRHF